MKRTATVALVLVLCAALVGLSGCYREELSEDEKWAPREMWGPWVWGSEIQPDAAIAESPSVALNGARALEAVVKMGAGLIEVTGGTGNALDADFLYGPAILKPAVDYEVTDNVGRLSVLQPEVRFATRGSNPNQWTLALANGVPLDLTIDLGAGEGTFNLAGLDLRSLKISLGAGEATLVLGKPLSQTVSVDIQAGIGELTIKVPDGVGVRVNGRRGGIGDFTADHTFSADGNAFVNDLYGHTPSSIEIDVQRGIGSVNLITVR